MSIDHFRLSIRLKVFEVLILVVSGVKENNSLSQPLRVSRFCGIGALGCMYNKVAFIVKLYAIIVFVFVLSRC